MKINRRTALAALAMAFTKPAFAATIEAVLYKNPQCSCCEVYAAYLGDNGFTVDVKSVNNLSQISADAGVPPELQGCHTMMVGGYAVDGLVPVDIVRKLLAEKPAIAGITLPGMPAGAPGMGGTKTGPWVISAFTKDGQPPTVFATV